MNNLNQNFNKRKKNYHKYPTYPVQRTELFQNSYSHPEKL